MADLKTLKGVAEKDRKLIEDAEALLGPEPGSMGFVKNLFWGRVREELVFPYPTESADEKKREGQAAGAKAWVVKPFKPEVLLNAVQKLILP